MTIIYSQIAETGNKSCITNIPHLTIRENLTDKEFNAILETGYNQAINGEVMSADEVFAKYHEGI